MPSFVLPLPPSLNHAYLPRAGGGRYKSDALRLWEDEAALVVRGWEPPKRRRLRVHIRLVVPANKLRTTDIDGYLKAAIDATVGKRADQWVDELWCEKSTPVPNDLPHMTVMVAALAAVGADWSE